VDALTAPKTERIGRRLDEHEIADYLQERRLTISIVGEVLDMIRREKQVAIMLKKVLLHVRCLNISMLTSHSPKVTPILAAADLSVDLDYEILIPGINAMLTDQA
jgi:hypothetical protein